MFWPCICIVFVSKRIAITLPNHKTPIPTPIREFLKNLEARGILILPFSIKETKIIDNKHTRASGANSYHNRNNA